MSKVQCGSTILSREMHIKSLQERMVELAGTCGRNSGRVLRVSRIIDRLVNEDLRKQLSA